MAPAYLLQTLQDAAVATGVGTILDISNHPVVAVQVTIAGTATITFEASVGSGTMTALPATNVATGAVGSTATATGIYLINCAPLTRFQARISAWSSGAVTAIAAAASESSAALAGALGAGSTTLAGPLGAHGGVVVEGVVSGTPVPVSGTITASGTVAIDQTTPNSTNRVTSALYGKVTNPGDTAILSTAAGRQLVAHGTANTAGAVITGGTVTSVDSADAARALAVALFLYNGSTNEPMRNPNVFKVVALAAGTAEATIWTPAAGKKFRLMGFILTCGAASTLTFKDNTAGTTIFAVRGTTDTPISPSGMGNGILSAAANNVLTVTRGTSATLDGVVFGTEE